MNLREMRFARIEGTEVLVQVHSAAEARTAIRELKHKKKELNILRRRLKKAQQTEARAHERRTREAAAQARRKGIVATLRRISGAFRNSKPQADLQAIERDIDQTDEILHNIDSCIVQLEGKLLV